MIEINNIYARIKMMWWPSGKAFVRKTKIVGSTPAHISMTAQEYIELKLQELETRDQTSQVILPIKEWPDFIYKKIVSKKFRKFSITPEYATYIKTVINNSLKNNLPLKFSFPFGGYKLWRLEETPETDWAELFTLIYYVKWLKPIADIYPPGIIFDFASDSIIVERMNNIPKEETDKYQESFEALIKFLEKYTPKNLKFTFTPISSFYAPDEFEQDLTDKLNKKKEEFGGLPILDDKRISMVELNVKLKPDQDSDPLWREKIELMHQAYYAIDKRRPYTKASDKILVFPLRLKDGRCISVGTTKTSVAKFWVGIGVLKKIENNFIEYILSPNQIKDTPLIKENISIDNLIGKNFKKIKIIN